MGVAALLAEQSGPRQLVWLLWLVCTARSMGAAAALLTRGWSVTSGSWHLPPTAALAAVEVQDVRQGSQGACPLPCPCRRVALLLKAGLPPGAKLLTWGQPYEYEVRSGCCSGEA